MVSAPDHGPLRHGYVFWMSFSRTVDCYEDLVFSLFDVGGSVCLIEQSYF